jgi:hypothetical protein
MPPSNGEQWLREDDLLDPYQLHRTRKPDDAERILSQQIYVDDLLISRPNPEDATRLIEEAIARFKRYQLKFCKVSSNVPAIQQRYPSQVKLPEIKSLSPSQDQNSDPNKGHSLGLQWNMRTDRFSIKTEHKNRVKARAGFLGQIMEPYDPFGIAAPAMLTCKLMQRELWPPPDNDPHGCRALGWDDPIPRVFDKAWNKVCQTCEDI